MGVPPGPQVPHESEDAHVVASALADALVPSRAVGQGDRILRAALEVVADEGTAAVTFARVAERAGVERSAIELRYADEDELLRDAFEESGAVISELLATTDRADDAVHLIIPALTTMSPYAQAFTRAVLDGYGPDTIQQDFPLAQHLKRLLLAHRDEHGGGAVDPRVAAAAIATLAGAWHFNSGFLERAYDLGELDEVEVRRQLSVVLEAIVGLVSGPRLG